MCICHKRVFTVSFFYTLWVTVKHFRPFMFRKSLKLPLLIVKAVKSVGNFLRDHKSPRYNRHRAFQPLKTTLKIPSAQLFLGVKTDGKLWRDGGIAGDCSRGGKGERADSVSGCSLWNGGLRVSQDSSFRYFCYTNKKSSQVLSHLEAFVVSLVVLLPVNRTVQYTFD